MNIHNAQTKGTEEDDCTYWPTQSIVNIGVNNANIAYYEKTRSLKLAVSDPAFSTGGGRGGLNLGKKPFICQDFCKKLHENERNWTQGRSPLDPPIDRVVTLQAECRLIILSVSSV